MRSTIASAPLPSPQLLTIPSPVPYDRAELGSGRGLTYEWEFWIDEVLDQIQALGGGVQSFVHEQAVASAVWNIPHLLGTIPSVVLVDGSGQEMLAELHYPDDQNVVVIHGQPYAGTAYLRA